MRVLILITAVVLATGCAARAPQPAPIQPVNQTLRFDRSEAASWLVRGSGMVRGAALIRRAGSDSATCAGRDVRLIPATPYADERMNLIYGASTASTMVRTDSLGPSGMPEPAPAAYLETTLTTRCDARGNFHFDQVGAGAFWIETAVRWTDGDVAQGGTIAQRVIVQSGQTVNVLLSP